MGRCVGTSGHYCTTVEQRVTHEFHTILYYNFHEILCNFIIRTPEFLYPENTLILMIDPIEILANKIRYDKNIKEIKIDDKMIKISLLADDLTLILQDLKSIEYALKLLNKFSLCSGLIINIEKAKAIFWEKSITSDHYPHSLSWIKTPLETLGI